MTAQLVLGVAPGGDQEVARWRPPLCFRWLGSVGASGLSGGVLGLSFEPGLVGAGGYAAPLALAAWFLIVTGAHASAVLAASSGYVFGAAFIGVHLWWLTTSVGLAAWAALALVMPMWWVPVALLAFGSRRRPLWPIAASAGWAASEVLRSAWPLGGMPWGRLGVGAVDTIWAQYLPYIGIAGTSFVVALLGATAAISLRLAWRRRWRSSMRVAALAATLGLAGAIIPYAVIADDGPGDTSTIAIVQGEVPGDGTAVAANFRRISTLVADQTVALSDAVAAGAAPSPDLVVWPENSIAVDPATDEVAASEIRRAARVLQAPLMVSGIVDGPTARTAYNRSLVWDNGALRGAAYTKAHPVPFGEYIPFRRWLSGLSDRFAEIPRDMLAGRADAPRLVGRLNVATAICFDIAYRDPLAAQVEGGAELIVVQTSNAMFTGTRQLGQQFAISRARAVELGRPVAVSSLNGLSGVIDRNGNVTALLPARRAGWMTAEVATARAVTPATRYGDLIEAALVTGAAGLMVSPLVRRLRRRIPRG
ncbi:apolipoprotein N-acyltransferase [Nocardioides sp. SOB77]|uniref:Apolipoprotein N-acyltransferase n=1 Tax=Nocardioides oceani TaxID=3058369 RepID=A0ABT8FM92_9ACTN|nr:apolipoprotein N-acyltransferase [Nocardioides oceani]MDN4175793.1 apolipoprotein N-acyltransferase [Nocardioides oceani]